MVPRHLGLTLDKWGPCAWNTLHAFAHSSPKVLDEERRAQTRSMLYLFGLHLPCPKCSRHWMEYLQSHLTEEALGSREALVRFLNDAHNDVNRRLGKRVFTLEEHYRVFSRENNAPASLLPLRSRLMDAMVLALALAMILRGRDRRRRFA